MSLTRTKTVADSRMSIIHAMPCMCCVQEGEKQPNRTEAHHIVAQSYRKHSGGDEATIPLCSWHHRAEPLKSHSKTEMGFIYGPSLATAKAFFVKRYGTERELLAKIDERLRTGKIR